MITFTTDGIGLEIYLPGEHKERSGFLFVRVGGKDDGRELHMRGSRVLEIFEEYFKREGFLNYD